MGASPEPCVSLLGLAGKQQCSDSLYNTRPGVDAEDTPLLPANVVLEMGIRGLNVGDWGVRVEDTIVVGVDGPHLLTSVERRLTPT